MGAKGCRKPLELEEASKASSLEPSEKAQPCLHLDSGLRASRTLQE